MRRGFLIDGGLGCGPLRRESEWKELVWVSGYAEQVV